MTPLAPHITAFFQHQLPVERGVSHHTSDSYAYAFKLLLEYASKRLHVPPSALHLERIDAPLVVAFLTHLEAARGQPAVGPTAHGGGNARDLECAQAV